MTSKVLRLLAIALSFGIAGSSRVLSAEAVDSNSGNATVPHAPAAEPEQVFLPPISVDNAFEPGSAVPPLPDQSAPVELAEPLIESAAVAVDPEDDDDEIPFGRPYNAPGWYSHPEWHHMDWVSGANGRFGEFALTGVDATPIELWDGLFFTNGGGFHFLDGPTQTDLPPRLFDFNWGLHYFGEVSPGVWFDAGFSGGLYTDFEDSVREGWRFPAHAVFSWTFTPEVQPVLGFRYFDRDNLGLLPVGGIILQPDEGLRLELVFPEPRVAVRVSQSEKKEHWLSLSGKIGGGEWAIEREPSGLADIVTYNDYQLILGLESINPKFEIDAFEIGYSFERDLEYRSGVGNFEPSETIFVRWVSRR